MSTIEAAKKDPHMASDELDRNGNAIVVQQGPNGVKGPFANSDLDRLAEALTMSSWETGINFSAYIGDLGNDRRATISKLHGSFGEQAAETCMVAVSPDQRAVEVATGSDVAKRLSDRSCNLAILSMTTSFIGGDLIGGIVGGLRMLSDQAGSSNRR